MPLNSRWLHNPIGIYLMSCYAYEVLNKPFLSDAEFDALGRFINQWYDVLEHRHKQFIDEEACAYTSAVTVPYEELPLIVLGATHHKVGVPFKESPIYQQAMLNAEIRALI